jgi:hypothetical protein
MTSIKTQKAVLALAIRRVWLPKVEIKVVITKLIYKLATLGLKSNQITNTYKENVNSIYMRKKRKKLYVLY